MHRRTLLAVALLVIAGTGAGTGLAAPTASPDRAQPAAQPAPPDPDEDVLGWENGYWYNESIDVDQSDGLTDAEQDAYVSRAMARVERLRQLEFESDVPVETIPRSEFAAVRQRNAPPATENVSDWNDLVWEALFVVGERQNADAAFDNITRSLVAGFYAPSRDQITVITETPDRPVIDNATLIHELTHALQDQQFNVSAPRFRPDLQDAQLAADGLIEGGASYVQQLYAQRCGEEWSCVATPESARPSANRSQINLGLYATIYQPYSDGSVYVDSLIERGGWDLVNRQYAAPPNTTEQIIHVDRTTDLAPIEFANRAQNGWSRFEDRGVRGYDRVGETSVFAMFWYQSYEYGIDVVDSRDFFTAEGPFDRYNYTSPPSAGWGNDRIVPYRNGDQRGYVFETTWDTTRDARQFYRAYRQILRGHDAARAGENVWVIPDGPFADAFYVARSGDDVVVVNGPTVETLGDIRAGISVNATNDTAA